MLNRFLPLAAPMCVSVSLPAHAQAQQGAARTVPTAAVHNQRDHGTADADTAVEFSFDHVPEGVDACSAFVATVPGTRS